MELPVITLRKADADDIPRLEALIADSVRRLQAPDYTESQREGALGTVFGVDRLLIADRTYFVLEADGDIVACGGWSKRRTLFGSDNVAGKDPALLDPLTEAAKIRAFFVHPGWARRGLGSRILRACDAEALAAGFTRRELGATLTGVPLYERHGFVEEQRIEAPLADGGSLPIVRMSKKLHC